MLFAITNIQQVRLLRRIHTKIGMGGASPARRILDPFPPPPLQPAEQIWSEKTRKHPLCGEVRKGSDRNRSNWTMAEVKKKEAPIDHYAALGVEKTASAQEITVISIGSIC